MHSRRCRRPTSISQYSLDCFFSHSSSLYIFSLATTVTPNTPCYYPDGTAAPDTPCNITSTDSHCCNKDAYCLTNGLCFDNTLTRGSCTDASWTSDACPQFCLTQFNPSNQGGRFPVCSTQAGSYAVIACDWDMNLCSSRSSTYQIGWPPVVLMRDYQISDSIDRLGASASASFLDSIATTTVTTTATATGTGSLVEGSGHGGGLSAGGKAGISIGVIVVVITAILIPLFFLRRAKQTIRRLQEERKRQAFSGSRSSEVQQPELDATSRSRSRRTSPRFSQQPEADLRRQGGRGNPQMERDWTGTHPLPELMSRGATQQTEIDGTGTHPLTELDGHNGRFIWEERRQLRELGSSPPVLEIDSERTWELDGISRRTRNV